VHFVQIVLLYCIVFSGQNVNNIKTLDTFWIHFLEIPKTCPIWIPRFAMNEK